MFHDCNLLFNFSLYSKTMTIMTVTTSRGVSYRIFIELAKTYILRERKFTSTILICIDSEFHL